MRTRHLALLHLAALALALAPTARAAEKVLVRDESSTFPLQDVRSLDLDVPVGEVHITVDPGAAVQARLQLRCDSSSTKCRERAQEIHLKPSHSGQELMLEVAGYEKKSHGIHHPEVEVTVTLPAAMALRLQLGVGDLHLRGAAGDVDAEVGVGEATVEVAESAVRSVSVEVGVGDANLVPRSDDAHRSGFLFLGNEINWDEGTGQSRVRVEVGVGEATVRLLPAPETLSR